MMRNSSGRLRVCTTAIAFSLCFLSFVSAQSAWNTAADGNWSIGANWSAGVPNGAADDAVIVATGASYVVTADIDVTLNLLTLNSSDATLFLSGRTWTINDKIQIDAGTLELRGTTTIVGNVVNSGGTIEIIGSSGGHNSAVISITSLTNDGTLNLTTQNSSWDAGLSGDVTNNGTMNILDGTGGARTYSGTMNNNGDVVVDRRFDVNGANDWNQNAGSIAGNALFAINGGTMNIDGGTMSGQVVVDDGTIHVLGTSTATGGVQAQGTTMLSGIVNNGLEVTVQGSGNGGNANGETQAGFINQGTITLESINSSWQSNFDATLGFTNGVNGTFRVRAGTGGNRDIIGDIINQGIIDGTDREYRQISGSLELAGGQLLGDVKVLNTAVDSTGSTSGEITLHGNANTIEGTINSGLTKRIRGANDGGQANSTVGTGGLTNQGLLILDSINSTWNTTLTGDWLNGTGGTAQTLASSGGAKTFDGLITNLGSLDFQANTTITGTGLNMDGGSLVAGATTTIDSAALEASAGSVSGLVIVRNGNLDFQSGSTLSGQIETRALSTLSGTINTGATVANVGANGSGAATLTTTAGAVNDGTLEMTSVNTSWNSTLDITAGFTNNGLLKSTVGTGGTKSITGQLDNFGQIDVGTQIEFTGAGVAMKGGSITGSELLHLSGGASFTAEQGSITGQVAVNDGQINFAAASTMTGEIEARGISTLDGTINSGAIVNIKGANLGATAALTTNVGAANDGAMTLDSINTTWASSLNVANGFTNNGSIQVLPGTGGNKTISGDLTNNGDLDGTFSPFLFSGTLNMNSGAALGTVIAKNTATTFGGAATGQLIIHDGASTAGGTIGSGMIMWVNGSNDGGETTVSTVGKLNNAGTIVVESSSTSWQSNLNGELLNMGTGLVEVNPGSGGARNLGFTLDNDGRFVFRTNTSLGVTGSAHDNRGTMTIETGRVDLIGDTFENSGLLEGNGILDLNGSVLFNNSGIVGPGLSPGLLTIDGDFNQDLNGTLAIELAGLLPGEFDLLNIMGDANLNGTLDLDISYAFMIGDTFRILNSTQTVSGTFSIEPDPLIWDVVYGGNFVDVVALRNVPEPNSFVICLMAGLLGLAQRRRKATVQ